MAGPCSGTLLRMKKAPSARPVSAPDDEPARRLDQSLVRSLYALLSEASVSRAARLGIAQPAPSRHLEGAARAHRRRAAGARQPHGADRARRAAADAGAACILADLSMLTGEVPDFDPARLRQSFRLASYDFPPRAFFADLAPHGAHRARGRPSSSAPGHALRALRQLADGEIDMVVTLWPERRRTCARDYLLTDALACGAPGPSAHARASSRSTPTPPCAGYLSSLEHVPGQVRPRCAAGRPGVVVHAAARTSLGMAPTMLAATDLVFTTGQLLAEDMAAQAPLAILPFLGEVKPFRYKLVRHERTHKNRAMAWLRGELIDAARIAGLAAARRLNARGLVGLRPVRVPRRVSGPRRRDHS